MYLLDQKTKKIMEECKERAIAAGLVFDKESLEYVVTNRDMLELSPKVMIPTLYDYWVNDVEVLKKKGEYKLYPSNPYETVINSRPAISFYNDNNPDWLNIMIFYHVLGHIDFFQNNTLFSKTWNDDFVGQALADKRLLESLRSEHGRWVDYVIEFSRAIDNIIGYFKELVPAPMPEEKKTPPKIAFFFDIFLQRVEKVNVNIFYKYIELYNTFQTESPETAEQRFFAEIKVTYPEFQAKYSRYEEKEKVEYLDILDYLLKYSPFLNLSKNNWMKSILRIIRNTSLYFSPQIRSKICNEGWASYWHDTLFRSDDRIKGHEVSYAKINSFVTSLPRVGLNPYAIGLRLLQYIEELADKGQISYKFQKIMDLKAREDFDLKTDNGKKAIFSIRKHFSDFMLLNTFVDQTFVDKHNLFVTGKRLNQERGTIEYYIKSKKAEDYKKMMIDSLYHPPHIVIDLEKTSDKSLYLFHNFEGKQLIKDFISDVMVGLEFLWGNQIELETTEIIQKRDAKGNPTEREFKRILYTMKDKKLSRKVIG